MGTQVTYAKNLPEIPSEYIEPYAQRFFMMQLESIYFGLISIDEAKTNLQAVSFFISSFAGLHANLATTNIYYKFINSDEEQIKNVINKTFE